MHDKASKEIIHETWYLQEKYVVVVDPNVLLHFPALTLPSFSKSQVCHIPPRVLQEKTKFPRVWERERENKSSKTELVKIHELIINFFFINVDSIFFIFCYFPSFFISHATHDLSRLFPPNSHYFQKQIAKNSIFPFESPSHLLCQFQESLINHKWSPSLFFCPTFSLEYMSHDQGLILCLLTFTWFFYEGCYTDIYD